MKFKYMAALLAATAATPAMATTFITGNIQAGTNVVIGAASDPQSASLSFATPGNGVVTATSALNNQGGVANASATVGANWSSNDAGSVAVIWEWTSRTTQATTLQTNQLTPNWSYTFVASGNGFFNISGSVTAGGDVFGLQPIYLSGNVPGLPIIGGTVSNPNGSGAYSFALVSGQQYTFGLYNYGNLNSVSGLTVDGHANAEIVWNIAYGAVPEPASWALMIGGIGLVGGALRRRKVATTVRYA